MKMKIITTPHLSSLPVILAYQKGYFTEVGLRPRISQAGAYSQIAQLILTDYFDTGELCYSEILHEFFYKDAESLACLPGLLLSFQKPAIYSLYDLDSTYYNWNQSELTQYYLPVPSEYSLQKLYSVKVVDKLFGANPNLVSFPALSTQMLEDAFYRKNCLGIVGDQGIYPFVSQNLRSYFKSSKYLPNTVMAFTRKKIESRPIDVAGFVEATNKAKMDLSKISLEETIDIITKAYKENLFTVYQFTDLKKAITNIHPEFPQIFQTEFQIDSFHAMADLMTIVQTEKTKYKSLNTKLLDLMKKVESGEKLFEHKIEEKKALETQEIEKANQNQLLGNNTFNKNIYRILFNESSELLFIFETGDFSIMDANPKFCQETGYSLRDLEDITLHTLLVDFNSSHPIIKYLESPEDIKYIPEISLHHRSGVKLIFDVYLNLIEGEENKKFLALLINNTEKKETMRLKHEFLSNISHELRTPMTNIQGYLDILMSDTTINFNPEHKEILNVIIKNTNRMIKLISNLLQLGKSSTINPESIEIFDPKPIIQDAVLLNKQMATEKGLQIIMDLEDGILLEGSKFDFSQVIVNLFVNALKYTEKGSVTLSCKKVENNICQIKVVDTGIGIDSKYHFSIFERFFRVPDVANKKIGGTGLGLAIAQETIYKMGGIITLDSLPGTGTTFVIMVPYVTEEM
jgi:PAS domain S-box-containing protein